MKSRTFSIMTVLFLFEANVFAQSYEGTTKGLVVRQVDLEKTEMKATTENGPWARKDKPDRPRLFVFPIGDSDTEALDFVKRVLRAYPDFFLRNHLFKLFQYELRKHFSRTKGSR